MITAQSSLITDRWIFGNATAFLNMIFSSMFPGTSWLLFYDLVNESLPK